MDTDPNKFIMWLHGFLELNDASTLNEQQLQSIKQYLNLVMKRASLADSKNVKILYREVEEQLYPKWEPVNQLSTDYDSKPLCKEYFDPFDYPKFEERKK